MTSISASLDKSDSKSKSKVKEHIVFKISRILVTNYFKYLSPATINWEGQENVPKNPTLFVANHYTRIETAILPYILFMITGKQVTVLADQQFFFGLFGKWLRICGAYPIQDKNRNTQIIGDLMTGKSNWVIFPEGSMIKNKKTFQDGRLALNCPDRTGPPHTGAATLALKAEIFKRSYLTAVQNNDLETMKYYQDKYSFSGPEDVIEKPVVLCPVNISYSPLRTEEHFFPKFIRKRFPNLGQRAVEEMEVEVPLLFSKKAVIDHYFAEPVHLDEYVSYLMKLKTDIKGVFSEESLNNVILDWQKRGLTDDTMKKVYDNNYINIDQIFSTAMRTFKGNEIHINTLTNAIYLAASEIKSNPNFRKHHTLFGNITHLIADQDYQPLKEILDIGIKEKSVHLEDEILHIDHENLANMHHFHSIRMLNKLAVFANELEPVVDAVRIIESYINQDSDTIAQLTIKTLIAQCSREFVKDFQEHSSTTTAPPEESFPIYLEAEDNQIGIVLTHGYLASPEQVRPLAEYLHSLGYTVFCPRLRGHGTNPEDLKERSLEDWYHNIERGIGVIKNNCKQYILMGYSLGAILSLLCASKKGDKVAGLVCINPAYSPKSLDHHLVEPTSLLNKLYNKFYDKDLVKDKIDVDENHDYPFYQHTFVKNLNQIKKAVRQTKKKLNDIKANTLILQSINDPLFNSSGAKKIHKAIQSNENQLSLLDSSEHDILYSQSRDEMYSQLKSYLDDNFPLSEFEFPQPLEEIQVES
ncbi:MAG: alpha/beta fold hydrolase [Candidatus Cloacimonetes bacterium]|nr:alpha/beta fold hydrolase [Candidatus Cloacimonadota bacterium]